MTLGGIHDMLTPHFEVRVTDHQVQTTRAPSGSRSKLSRCVSRARELIVDSRPRQLKTESPLCVVHRPPKPKKKGPKPKSKKRVEVSTGAPSIECEVGADESDR